MVTSTMVMWEVLYLDQGYLKLQQAYIRLSPVRVIGPTMRATLMIPQILKISSGVSMCTIESTNRP